jgi:hypothetical protein
MNPNHLPYRWKTGGRGNRIKELPLMLPKGHSTKRNQITRRSPSPVVAADKLFANIMVTQ